MITKIKLDYRGKEKQLVEQIEIAKTKLAKFKENQLCEIGLLAKKHGLCNFQNKTLDEAFAKIARELEHGSH